MQSGVPEFYHIVFYLVHFTLYNSVNSRKKHVGYPYFVQLHSTVVASIPHFTLQVSCSIVY